MSKRMWIVTLVVLSATPVAAQAPDDPGPAAEHRPDDFADCTGTDPSWSPDGDWLALVLWCGEDADLWRVRPDGSGALRLTEGGGQEHTPVWSPDGCEIVFTARIEGEDSELWAVPAGGGDLRRLTDDDWPQSTPSLSPDGRRVVYESRRDDNADLFVLDLATGTETRLTSRTEPDLFPRWSPDGARIAFQGRRDGRYSILSVSPEGGPVSVLWAPAHHAAAPAWGPDARRLLVAGSGEGVDELFLVELSDGAVDGAVRVSRLLARDGIEFAPTWSPDGTRIAFIVREGSAWNVFVRDMAGEREWRLTGS